MKLHKEGYKIIIVTFATVVLIAAGIDFFIPFPILRYVLYFGLFIHMAWTLRFFRVPKREINYGDNHILASADGEVVAIEEVHEYEYFKDQRILVSVFMSAFNVHVNWYPIDGKVVYTKYHPGKYLLAKHPKSSLHNERNSIVVEKSPAKAVLARQIAGIMARRIISYAKVGGKAKQGEEFGIIRFGSRVDFFLPLDAKINVKMGQQVRAQKTVIAEFG
ncbi:MAG: phosphatidylserine decarboxylase family protein [Bacteroidetes bacterium]|nr:MAG: phosphatidylserine decarboxylase family protein [Bacteroidota bacterium]